MTKEELEQMVRDIEQAEAELVEEGLNKEELDQEEEGLASDVDICPHAKEEQVTALSQPKHLISLSTSAVLVCADVRVWSATAVDPEISSEVTTAKKADKNAGKFVKNILNNNAKHKAIVNYRQTIYNWMKRRTYRWNKSQDLLPSMDLPMFKQEWAHHELQFNIILDEFINDYDHIVSNMAFSQGDMFDRDDYPTKDEVRRKFSAQMFVAEVPTNDFRCSIANDIAEDLYDTYTKQTASIIEGIAKDQGERLIDLMVSISFCCDIEDKDSKRRRKIYDTTLDKAKSMCDLFKTFNLTSNPQLEEARANLERTLKGVDAEAIRGSDSLRISVKKDVDSILEKFSSFKCV